MKVHGFEDLIEARLVKRYKRFLADVVLPDGSEVTVHCPNPGRMSSILPTCSVVYLSDLSGQPNPKRKLRYRWELAQTEESLVMVNTQLANRVANHLLFYHEQLRRELEITSSTVIKSEFTLPQTTGSRTRFDFALLQTDQKPTYLEVKQVSMRTPDLDQTRWAAFPDAVTTRGKRHVEELTVLQQKGCQTVLLYIVGRSDVDRVRAAQEIDPAYADAFQRAQKSGVKMLAYRIDCRLDGLYLGDSLPVS